MSNESSRAVLLRRVPRAALLVAVALLAGCTPAPPQALGTLERDRISLPAPTSEPILAIDVREGDTVAADAVLVRLDDSRSRAALAGAQSEVQRLTDALAELDAGARSEEREQARAQVASALAQERNAGLERERIDALVARGADAWKPLNRDRVVSAALRAYAAMTTSADTGAVRDVSQIERR